MRNNAESEENKPKVNFRNRRDRLGFLRESSLRNSTSAYESKQREKRDSTRTATEPFQLSNSLMAQRDLEIYDGDDANDSAAN